MAYYWEGVPSQTEIRILTIDSGITTNMNSGHSYKLNIEHKELYCDISISGITEIIIGYIQYNNNSYNTTTIIFNGINNFNKLLIKLPLMSSQNTFKIYNITIQEILNTTDVSSDYVVTNSGITHYGVPMKKINERYNDDKIIKIGDSIYNLNIQDTILFDSYYKFRKNYKNSLESALITTPIIYEYYNNNNNYINDDYTEQDKLEFKRWNQNLQTSTLNFERKAGLQIKTINQYINSTYYHDLFSGGTFYNGNFYGKWVNGKWYNGVFFGWNDLINPSGITSLTAPIKTNPDIKIKNTTYYKNIEYLKRKKKYYEIPPWEKNKNQL